MDTKIKKEKKPAFQIDPISNWSVSKYGIPLYVNVSGRSFGETISLDVEDDECGNFVGIGIFDGTACYWWSDWKLAKQLTTAKFVAHNGVTDIRKLQQWGFKIDDSWLLWDTQLTAHILDSTRGHYGLKDLVEEDLGIKCPHYEDIVGKHKKKCPRNVLGCCGRITLDKQAPDLVAEYNACDTYTTYKLYEHQLKQCTDNVRTYHNTIEKPISFIFSDMSDNGIQVDLAYLTSLKGTLEAQKKPLTEAIANELGPINLNSPKQLLGALNAKGISPVLKGKPSTDKRALEAFRTNPVVSSLLNYSELDTLLSNFVTPYLERNEAVVHPQFRQTGTRTGRPSCFNPNLLQIPKRSSNGKLVRRMFVARDGCLFGDCDYSEGEPRMLAHLSKDPAMCELFAKDSGFHSYFAEKLGITRDRAKVFDLETYYRATKFGVAKHLNCNLNEAQKRIDEAWALFPTLYIWEQKVIYEAKKNGYITTLMGRRIKIEGLDSNNEWKRSSAERQCMNNLAQASLQECMKKAMIEISKTDVNMLVQIYDSVLIESPEQIISSEIEIVIDKMTSMPMLCIPMKVDSKIGRTWDECK